MEGLADLGQTFLRNVSGGCDVRTSRSCRAARATAKPSERCTFRKRGHVSRHSLCPGAAPTLNLQHAGTDLNLYTHGSVL